MRTETLPIRAIFHNAKGLRKTIFPKPLAQEIVRSKPRTEEETNIDVLQTTASKPNKLHNKTQWLRRNLQHAEEWNIENGKKWNKFTNVLHLVPKETHDDMLEIDKAKREAQEQAFNCFQIAVAIQTEKIKRVADKARAQAQHARTKYNKAKLDDPAKNMQELFRLTKTSIALAFAFALGAQSKTCITPVEFGALYDRVWEDIVTGAGENPFPRFGSWVSRTEPHIHRHQNDAFIVPAFNGEMLRDVMVEFWCHCWWPGWLRARKTKILLPGNIGSMGDASAKDRSWGSLA